MCNVENVDMNMFLYPYYAYQSRQHKDVHESLFTKLGKQWGSKYIICTDLILCLLLCFYYLQTTKIKILNL